MLNDFLNSGGMLALTFFQFVMVCVGLFYTILESSRQKKDEYAYLAWGLSAYSGALIIRILTNLTIESVQAPSPIWTVISIALAAGGVVILTNGLVAPRLLDRSQFSTVIKYISISLSITFAIAIVVALVFSVVMIGIFCVLNSYRPG